MTPGLISKLVAEGADIAPSPSLEQVREFIRASKADSTLRGYKSDWRHFCNWSWARRLFRRPLPSRMTSGR
jgi:hypothetical protein